MATLLMCKPSYYSIDYEINPWMSRRRPADPRRAACQWSELYRTLVDRLGAEVELIEPVNGLPDLVFAANAGLVRDNLFVPSTFRFQERAREEPVWKAWFASRGYRIITLPSRQKFEGEGDALVAGDAVYAGWRFRSHRASHDTLAGVLNMPVVSLRLVDPYYYHLDTCFMPLGSGRVMYYPEAFAPESRRCIEEHFPQRITVTGQEARRFICNSLVIGDWVVTAQGCPEAERELAAWGYRVITVDTSEFIKSGGSVKCMALFLDSGVMARSRPLPRLPLRAEREARPLSLRGLP